MKYTPSCKIEPHFTLSSLNYEKLFAHKVLIAFNELRNAANYWAGEKWLRYGEQ